MFTWRQIHEETASKLLAYENRQGELIALLEQMEKQGLNVIPLTDHPKQDSDSRLTSIDPFTFFAVFNRQLTIQNRRRNWQFLKDAWDLKSAVPNDFHGIPTITPQNSWFFAWEHRRDAEDIPRLWRLARAVLEKGWQNCAPNLFAECLEIHTVGVAKLTTGLFWIAPTQMLPLPATTVQYLSAKGITVDISDKASYDAVMNAVRSRLSGDFIMESHNAWLHCQAEADLNFDFSEDLKDGIWNAFRKGFPDFVDFSNPGEKFHDAEVAYKRAGLAKFEKLGGRAEVARLLAANDPAGALGVITKSAALNIASFQSWRPSLGSDQPTILSDVLNALLMATEGPYQGRGTLLPVFDAIVRNGLKPAWDTLSVVLWALRPTDYFPIKISYLPIGFLKKEDPSIRIAFFNVAFEIGAEQRKFYRSQVCEEYRRDGLAPITRTRRRG